MSVATSHASPSRSRSLPRSLPSAGALRHAALAGLGLLALGCSSSYAIDQRSSFAETIGQPEALLRAKDPRGLSERMAEIQVPETDEHHAELLRVLRSVKEIDTDRLLLLTHAVAPGEKPLGPNTKITINGKRVLTARAPRGGGPYAHIVDTLLLEGTAKLVDVNRYNAGRLIGRTETQETMITLVNRFLPRVDDGSPEALSGIFAGFEDSYPDAMLRFSGMWGTTSFTATGNDAKSAFVEDVLFARGLAEGEREMIALKALTGSSRRLKALQARLPHYETIEKERFEEYLDLLSGSSSRLELLGDHAHRIHQLDHDGALDLAKTLAGSSSRLEILPRLVAQVDAPLDHEALQAYVKSLAGSSSRLELLEDLGRDMRFGDVHDMIDTLKLFAGSSSRLEALELILDRSEVSFSGREMKQLVAMYAGSSSRMEAIERIEGRVERPIEASDARSLLKLFSGTSSKLDLLRELERDYVALSRDEREDLLDLFSSNSSKKKARKLLEL